MPQAVLPVYTRARARWPQRALAFGGAASRTDRRLAAPLCAGPSTGNMGEMKNAGVFAVTYHSITQFETRHRLIEAELEHEHAKVADRRVVELPPRRRARRRWFRALRGAAA